VRGRALETPLSDFANQILWSEFSRSYQSCMQACTQEGTCAIVKGLEGVVFWRSARLFCHAIFSGLSSSRPILSIRPDAAMTHATLISGTMCILSYHLAVSRHEVLPVSNSVRLLLELGRAVAENVAGAGLEDFACADEVTSQVAENAT
jgi:hypothetical protein